MVFWVFGYGSLIWKPPPHAVEQRCGYVKGVVRRFAQSSIDHRGVPERPGRVVTVIDAKEWYGLLEKQGVAIDHDPSDDIVWGMAYRIDPAKEEEVRAYLDHREKNGYSAVQETVYSSMDGKEVVAIEDALMYLGRLDNPAFIGYSPVQELAERIISCEGPSGPNRDYLFRLAESVRSLYTDVEDEYLFGLEAKVNEILRRTAMAAASRPRVERSLTSQFASLPTTPSILLPPREYFESASSSSALTPPGALSDQVIREDKVIAEIDKPSPYLHIASSPAHLTLLTSLHDIAGQPISTLLREGTQKAHSLAEHSDGARALIAGTLDEREYLRYLVVLWVMYKGLEEAMGGFGQAAVNGAYEKAQSGIDGVKGIWKRRRLLSRRRGLEEDIKTFTKRITATTDPPVVKLHSAFPFPLPIYLHSLFTSPPAALSTYTSRLSHLAKNEPGRLIAHAYVRYLGDLSGGQLVAQRIKRTYSLGVINDRSDSATKTDRSSSSRSSQMFPPGTKFYEFDFNAEKGGDAGLENGYTGSSGTKVSGTAGWEDEKGTLKENIEEVKGWFRETMDLAVGDDEDLKAALVDEAITAFQLSTSLFSLLSAPAPTIKQTPPAMMSTTLPTALSNSPATGASSAPSTAPASPLTNIDTRTFITYTTLALVILAIVIAVSGLEVEKTSWWKAVKGMKDVVERFAGAN